MSNMNMDSLIELAGKKLGIPTEELRTALKKGDVGAVTSKLSESDRNKVNAVLNDPKLSEQFKNKYTRNSGK